MKLRLLVLSSTYPRWKNDPEPSFVHELSRRLTEQFEVTVLCPRAPGAPSSERMDGVEVIRYRYAPASWETLVNDGGIVTNLKRARWKLLLVPGFVLMQVWHAWRLVRAGKVDVIHAHWLLPQGLIAASLQWVSGKRVPFLVTSHGADLYALRGRLFDTLKRFVVRKASAVTVVSSAMREHMRAHGIDTGKVSVLSMGVDMMGRFCPDNTVVRSSNELLFVGRLVEKKGLRYLLEALPAVLRRIPEVRLTVAGFGPEESALRGQVRSLGLDEHVHFLGAIPQSELPALYRRAALFVAPFIRADSGDEEGLGLVLVEAAGCGCPVVAGDVAALTEVFEEDGDVLVNPRNVGNFSEKLIEVMVCTDQVGKKATQRRDALIKKFDWQRVAERYGRVLIRCCGNA